MPKLTEEQLNRARKMFLASRDGADARKRIDALTQSDAKFMETSLEKHVDKIKSRFARAANDDDRKPHSLHT